MKLRIAYQGVPGAYSHIAGKTVYPGQEYVSCLTFEQAMNAIQNREVDFADDSGSRTLTPDASPTFIFFCRKPDCMLSGEFF